jgi:sensor histidine kinase YesM
LLQQEEAKADEKLEETYKNAPEAKNELWGGKMETNSLQSTVFYAVSFHFSLIYVLIFSLAFMVTLLPPFFPTF